MTLHEILQKKLQRIEAARENARSAHTSAEASVQLARDLPAAILSGLDEQVRSGELLQRVHRALELAARRGLDGDNALVAALGALLREQGSRAGAYLAARAEDWRAIASREEGGAAELQAVVLELAPLVQAEAPQSPDVAPGGADGPPDGAEAVPPASGPVEALQEAESPPVEEAGAG